MTAKICLIHLLSQYELQRFSEVPDQLGMAILFVISGNPLLWAFLMQNFNLGIAKMSVIPENPLFPNPLLPKTSVNHFIAAKFASSGATCTWKNLNENNYNEDCVDIYGRKMYWGDHSCFLKLPFICEVSELNRDHSNYYYVSI